jgi:hypothetical protein
MRACHIDAPEGKGWGSYPPQALTDPDVPASGIRFLRTPGFLCADCRMHNLHSGKRRLHQVVDKTLLAHPLVLGIADAARHEQAGRAP